MDTALLAISQLAGRWDGDDHMDGGWGTAWMWLWMVLFWGALIAVVVWAGIRSTTQTRRQGANEHARDILADRYARGEIDTDQYRRQLEALR